MSADDLLASIVIGGFGLLCLLGFAGAAICLVDGLTGWPSKHWE